MSGEYHSGEGTLTIGSLVEMPGIVRFDLGRILIDEGFASARSMSLQESSSNLFNVGGIRTDKVSAVRSEPVQDTNADAGFIGADGLEARAESTPVQQISVDTEHGWTLPAEGDAYADSESMTSDVIPIEDSSQETHVFWRHVSTQLGESEVGSAGDEGFSGSTSSEATWWAVDLRIVSAIIVCVIVMSCFLVPYWNRFAPNISALAVLHSGTGPAHYTAKPPTASGQPISQGMHLVTTVTSEATPSAAKPQKQRKQWCKDMISKPSHHKGVVSDGIINVDGEVVPGMEKRARRRTSTPEPLQGYQARRMYLASVGKSKPEANFIEIDLQPYPFKSSRLREEAEKEVARVVASAAEIEDAVVSTERMRVSQCRASGGG
jgi:hypothetical protein